MRFLGIRRKTEFSPNHVLSDSLIFSKTAQALGERGVEVVELDEGAVSSAKVAGQVVFSMAQGPLATRELACVEQARSCLIVNSPRAVLNCYRVNLVRRLPEAGIPFPRSVIVDTRSPDDPAGAWGPGKAWLKRGDVHAVHSEDVVLSYNAGERAEILREFQGRGIESAIVQEHLEGDTVKFYAVRGEDFFHWFYLNGGALPVNGARLRELAQASAEALGLQVYGGDAIVARDGSLRIIDINDWPSFAAVRDQAAAKIAQLLLKEGQAYARS